MNTIRIVSFAAVVTLAFAPVAFAPVAGARGGGPGGGGGGMMGGGFGGGGMMGGGYGGGGAGNPGSGFNPSNMPAGMKHLLSKHGGQGEQALADLEDRKNLITERRKRLADGDRAVNQESRLAADRLNAVANHMGDDVR